MESTNYDKVIAVIAKQLRKKPEELKPEHTLAEDLGADSLDLVEMLMTLEDEHGVTIPDDDAPKLKTVAQIAQYLDAHSVK